MVLPSIIETKDYAKRTVCSSNLRQIGMSMIIYAEDNSNQYPTCDKWCDLIKPYIGDDETILTCPAAPEAAVTMP